MNSDPSQEVHRDAFVLATFLGACADLLALDCGKQVHAHVFVDGMGLELDRVLCSSLINLYGKYGDLDSAARVESFVRDVDEFSLSALISGYANAGRMREARRVFDSKVDPCSVLWNSIISGCVSNGEEMEAVNLFSAMLRDGVRGDASTVANILSVASGLLVVELVKQIHLSNVPVACSCGRGISICMYPLLKQAQGPYPSLSCCSLLLNHCLSQKSLNFVKIVHAHFLKLGLNTYTYLGNRCLDLYSEFGHINDALKVFDDISHKNSTSWNICLKGLLKSGQPGKACHMFDAMPVRDVVSWNSMISGYASCGYLSHALELFVEMQGTGVRPSGFTFSILMSLVSSSPHAKQIHCRMIRSGVDLDNVVLGNSLINIYGKLGLVEYAFGVIMIMKQFDVISWNSLIWACHSAGHHELALEQFYRMRGAELLPDQFTCSVLMSVCSNLRDLDKGKQVFAFCFKMGFVYNSIVSSAAIDLFSKCNRLEDSVRLFKKQDQWDSPLCNSMISSFARHDLGENALQLFVLTLRKNIRPTEYMVSSLLSSVSIFLPVEVGNQIHSLVPKLGFESDAVVANSLVDMYAKFGFIGDALNIFNEMKIKDLVSWNTIMMGLTYYGRVSLTMDLFRELLTREGILPDRITLTAVLLACNYGLLVDEGIKIFSSMEMEFGVKPGEEHYACVVEMLSKAGKLKEAIDIIETMPCRTTSDIWRSILSACAIYGDLQIIEGVAKKIMDRESQTSLPYLVLAQAYQMRGRWDSMVRMRKAVENRGTKEFIGHSWIGIRNNVYTFASNQLQHYGGKDLYLVLNLLVWEMETEGYV
ncbi:Pentatricopeptide repeat-containing protein, mitochondrial [Glycine soja]|nr:Pentatricopeptide repeat-containing protein, mitochondrial [Glycine soja]